MKKAGWIVFKDNEKGYQAWLVKHPDGYVLNMKKNKNPKYRVLHTVACDKIKNYTEMAKEGGFTERDYIKVCADDLEDLREWSRSNGRPDGSFSGKHNSCYPPRV